MTSVEVVFRYAVPPSEAVTFALANISEVYGIRRLKFNRAALMLCVEYDATRLNAATIANLVRQAGLEVEAVPPQGSAQPASEPTAAL